MLARRSEVFPEIQIGRRLPRWSRPLPQRILALPSSASVVSGQTIREAAMTVGQVTVDLKMNAEPFKEALAEVTAAIEELEAALARLRATGIEISLD